jgi:peptide/nickel transport system substrate-binding protein
MHRSTSLTAWVGRRLAVLALVAGALLGFGSATSAQTLRVVMHSDLKILDPVWTTAYIVRNHGYMIYDMLFALDAKLEPQPQMVDRWTVSDDKLTWTFTLREGLAFHDGSPVTSEDVVASLRRWGTNDTIGKRLFGVTKELAAVDDRTFRLTLSEPFGLVLKALAKPASMPPFIMPKRVAATPASQQIADTTGSGPFIFKRDEWKPGERVVYVKNPNYRPRPEAPSGLAGGKVVKVERVEWVWISDPQTQINALMAGEIDMLEQPSHDLLALLEKDRGVEILVPDGFGNQYVFRVNHLQPPFDNPKIRRAVAVAFNQGEFLKATIGDARYYKECKALFVCGTPLESTAGMDGLLESRFDEARKLLQEAGYDGRPIVLLHSTDLQALTNLGPVAKALLERAGFKVDMQSMDWQSVVTRRAKKDPPDKGGWNAMMTAAAAVLLIDPANHHYTEATGEKAVFGWPTDAKLEELRAAFVREPDPARQKAIAEQVQIRVMEVGTVIPLGQYLQPLARRKGVTGNVPSPVTVFWNIEKK